MFRFVDQKITLKCFWVEDSCLLQFLLQLEESNKYRNSFKDSREMKKQQVRMNWHS